MDEYTTFPLAIHEMMDFGWFLLFDYYKHLSAGFCVSICFHFSWLYTYVEDYIEMGEAEKRK